MTRRESLLRHKSSLASPESLRLRSVSGWWARAQSCVAGRRAWPRAWWEEEGVDGKQPCFCLARSGRDLCFTAGRPSRGGSCGAEAAGLQGPVGNVTVPPAA